MEKIKRTEVEKRIDVLEDDIVKIDPTILYTLLTDKTTGKNILWGTKDYRHNGSKYEEDAEIKVELITGEKFFNVIQPRAAKTKEVQEKRIKERAEVFTPSWICNIQNNQIDEAWFGYSNVFNTPHGTTWTTKEEKIVFADTNKDWKSYATAQRLEMTCGEAPYIVSRYDTTTGESILLHDRIGLFDRKMRVVDENCEDDTEWTKWGVEALKSVYGFEFQGDSLLNARENVLYSYIDYYKKRFNKFPPVELLRNVANIIAWNFWQMDGLRCVVPYSCHDIISQQTEIFDSLEQIGKTIKCPGCEKNNLFQHTGTYCKICDWANQEEIVSFVDIVRKGRNNG